SSRRRRALPRRVPPPFPPLPDAAPSSCSPRRAPPPARGAAPCPIAMHHSSSHLRRRDSSFEPLRPRGRGIIEAPAGQFFLRLPLAIREHDVVPAGARRGEHQVAPVR